MTPAYFASISKGVFEIEIKEVNVLCCTGRVKGETQLQTFPASLVRYDREEAKQLIVDRLQRSVDNLEEQIRGLRQQMQEVIES